MEIARYRSIFETMEVFNTCHTFLTLLTYSLGVGPGEQDPKKIVSALELWRVHSSIQTHVNPVCYIFSLGAFPTASSPSSSELHA